MRLASDKAPTGVIAASGVSQCGNALLQIQLCMSKRNMAWLCSLKVVVVFNTVLTCAAHGICH
ncbi:hypothetical protein XFUD_11215 [Xylella fastidiosa]|nr:hypothetical protein XFUD_11215 [Xylella fastidiosa]ARO69458.1 hypothetical protein B9J09_10965 [Xylella fastidiosa subsp. pauca]ETE29556.1 hypothetical protein B398_11650 [Xylella fastidiosa 32]OCA57075.1 hypothetical protein AA93_11025 [Xylella fastidiosa subsp. pauca 11399]ALR02792.1 hypothetical protein OY18_11960 [Xylella fastidiosa]